MAAIDPSQLYSYLINQGANSNEATMLTSAAGAESGWDPNKTHDVDKTTGLPTGYGMFGHRQDRLSAMQDASGSSLPNWQQQASFALNELRSRPESAAVNAASSPRALTVAQMYYERPQGFSTNNPTNGDNFDGRLAYTQQIMNGQMPSSNAKAGTMDPNDPNSAVAQMDPAARAQYMAIIQQGQQQAGQPGQTPQLGGAASGVAPAAGGAGGTPILSRLLFGNGGLNGMMNRMIPTPAGGQGLIGGGLSGLQSAFGGSGGVQMPGAASMTPAPGGPGVAAIANPAGGGGFNLPTMAQGTPGGGLTPNAGPTGGAAPALASIAPNGGGASSLPLMAQAGGLSPQNPQAAAITPAAGAPQGSLTAASSPLMGGSGSGFGGSGIGGGLGGLLGGLTGQGGGGLMGALGGGISSGISSGLSGLGGLFGLI